MHDITNYNRACNNLLKNGKRKVRSFVVSAGLWMFNDLINLTVLLYSSILHTLHLVGHGDCLPCWITHIKLSFHTTLLFHSLYLCFPFLWISFTGNFCFAFCFAHFLLLFYFSL